MKKLSRWLSSVFHVDVVWMEKGNGQWVKRRHYHPVLRAIAVMFVLYLCVSWVFSGHEHEPKAPEPETQPTAPAGEVAQLPGIQLPHFRITDFPDLSRDVYPGPIPDTLKVADDEYWLRVSKSGYKLYLYRGQDVEKAYEVAVGKNPGDKERVGDNKTPNGTFTVQSIEDSRTWSHDFRDGKGTIRGAYGPWFIRLRTGWRGIGIHGTHDPDSLGSMVSEGCIRMHNSELEELRQFASARMKVVIEE